MEEDLPSSLESQEPVGNDDGSDDDDVESLLLPDPSSDEEMYDFADVSDAPPPPAAAPPLQDIVRDKVLMLLPVRTLLRFRAVSDDWNRRISAPLFRHRQAYSNCSLSGLLHCDPDPFLAPSIYCPFRPAAAHAIPDPALSFLPAGRSHVLASAGGLLCCSHNPFLSLRQRYLVCNPATRDWAELPPSPVALDGVALHFAPSHDNIHDDYELICTERRADSGLGFTIFSSRNGGWRVSPYVIPENAPVLLGPRGVVAGRRAHWRTTEGKILRYDAASGSAEVLDVPEELEGATWEMGALDGSLYCVGQWPVDGVARAYKMAAGGGEGWVLVREMETAAGANVRPVVVQEGGWEMVVWVDGAVVGFRAGAANGELLSAPCPLELDPALELDPSELRSSDILSYTSSFAFVKKFTDLNEGPGVIYRSEKRERTITGTGMRRRKREKQD